ncbi:putative RING-H2 finger protein ATL21A [Chenopodium quinoa]|uniref:putative RING-H2 finger protein ATL21A n=1 Tax=Chenopodium quinoa TaxID=63459 RepID=UPI000B77DC66|nr:putative RING-H2 finger protein ATL21A [Chenopodium quinoa]
MDKLIRNVRLMIFFLLSISLVALSTTTNTKQSCIKSICGRHNGYLSIRFPFRLVNIQPESCGYPGFDLFCDASNTTLLHIPNSGSFSVQGIDYSRQQIKLSDPDDCLAKRLLSGLDLSHSPFRFKDFYDFSYYNCSEKHENYTDGEDVWRQEKISCLSTVPDYATIGVQPEFFSHLLEPWCDTIRNNVTIPVDSITEISSLSAQMLLVWDKPNCGLCEETVRRCEFKNDASTSLETVCIDYDFAIGSGQLSKEVRYAIGFSVGLGVPAIPVIALILYRKVTRSRRRAAGDDNNGSNSVDTNMQG